MKLQADITPPEDAKAAHLTTLSGVFLPVVEAILGAPIFVLLPTVVGQGGIGVALLIGFMCCLSVCRHNSEFRKFNICSK